MRTGRWGCPASLLSSQCRSPGRAPGTHPTDLGPLRLVGGLASENVRWAESVQSFKSQGITLCGDVLLISAFVSYVGYFTKKYRNELMEKFWVPYINKLKAGGPQPGTLGEGPAGQAAPNVPSDLETEAFGSDGGPAWPALPSSQVATRPPSKGRAPGTWTASVSRGH